MKRTQINIRDPFVLRENGTYYLYGTRAANFGRSTAGFDVYKSADLENWSEATECFNSQKHNLNTQVNWAPEVHKYNGRFYMFATFTQENGLRGTYILSSDSPEGPFIPYSSGAVTPCDWECLDGTLYIDKNGVPYLVFCHEHTQITDSPFLYRTKEDELIMIWSTFINGKYAQCMAKSDNGEIDGTFIHLEPLITNDGGHGMIFQADNALYLTYHSPNTTNKERPVFKKIADNGDKIISAD